MDGQNQRTSISVEGKISILLGLIGLGGVGFLQILPHPYNDYVGWTLIWVAIIGTVALGVYHVATTVESPRHVSKPRPTTMTAADVGFLTALGASAISLVALGLRHRSVAAILALIACAAVAFDFVDRHWFTPNAPVEYSVSADNAILDVQTVLKGIPSQELPQYFANLQLQNSGKATALGLQHIGVTAYAEGAPVDAFTIGSQFESLKAQLKLIPYTGNGEIRPGNNNIWYTVVGPPVKDDITKKLDDGNALLLVLNLMRYKDDKISSNQFIYTETCIYFVKIVTHLCETGHNRTYISN
jgi:hypothetical protein